MLDLIVLICLALLIGYSILVLHKVIEEDDVTNTKRYMRRYKEIKGRKVVYYIDVRTGEEVYR